jgi:hypothetical protein
MVDDKEECFVVCAIGADGSPQRTHADWVLEGIIKPLFAEHYPKFKVHRADHMNVPGLIDAQIIDKLLNAKLVIADLTWLNPNAFYEIGIRHVVGKPIIHMNLATEAIPFDNKMYLSLPFSVTRPQDLTAAKAGLKSMVDAVLDPDYVVDNPVVRARGQAQFAQTASPPDKVLLDQIEALATRVKGLERRETLDPLHISPRPQSASSALGLGRPTNALSALNSRSESVTLRFELEDHMDENALLDFKKHYIDASLGVHFHTSRNNPRSFEVDCFDGTMDDGTLRHLIDTANQSGIVVSVFRP